MLHDSAPEIYPVNHAVDGRSIVFRTDPGTKLHGLLRSPAVCFEVDAADPSDGTGWSVLVKGRAVEVRDPHDVARLGDLGLTPWALGDEAPLGAHRGGRGDRAPPLVAGPTHPHAGR